MHSDRRKGLVMSDPDLPHVGLGRRPTSAKPPQKDEVSYSIQSLWAVYGQWTVTGWKKSATMVYRL